MQALILGATGATGRDLLDQLLADPTFEKVLVFVRRPLNKQHPRLQVQLVNFNQEGEWKGLVKGDVLFSCLGTTLKTAGSKQAQWEVDHDYQYAFARAARNNGVGHYVLVSADMASPRSRMFYSRMKGLLEEAVKKLGFPRVDIFRPPLLVRKDTDRAGERYAYRLLRFFNGLGLFRAQRPLATELLAKAMIQVAKEKAEGVYYYRNREIREKAGSA